MSRRKWARYFGGAAAVSGGAVAVGIASAVTAGVILARKAVTREASVEAPFTVERVEDVTHGEQTQLVVWIRGPKVGLPGQYSFLFDQDAGHARLGRVLSLAGTLVAREVVAVDRGVLAPGVRGRGTGWWYVSPEELGFRTEHITYDTELGPADAWIVYPKRARKQRWAVHVHGRGARREETLRGVAPLARAGITSLIISYRNDPGAPVGEYGRYGIGIAEARDVDAAIAEARRRGAGRVTLFGWSMGGTASLLAATSGSHRDVIDGLILDSPAIDWAALLRYHAHLSRAPRPVADFGIQLLDYGIVRAGEPGGLRFDHLSAAAFARALTVPVLIHAGEQDSFVPCQGAQELAAARPDLVQLRLQPAGEHVRLWNVDPEPWERVTEAFARAIPRPPWRGE